MALEVSDDRLDAALRTLANTDVELGDRKALVLRSEFMAKHAEALTYKALTEGGVEDKKMSVRVAPEVVKAWNEHFDAVREFETLKARRERQIIVVELWRSIQANRRVGNVR